MRSDGRTYVPEYADYRRLQRARRLAFLQENPNDKAHGRRASYDAGCKCTKCLDPELRAKNARKHHVAG